MMILPVIKKEFRQIKRDRRALGILIFLPGFLLLLIGYALNFDVKHLKLVVYDEDRSAASREFVSSLVQSEYFELVGNVDRTSSLDGLLERGEAAVALVIPADFSKVIHTGGLATVQVIIDGSNSNTASIAAGYMTIGIQSYSSRILTEWLEQRGRKFSLPIDVQPKLWYNPELKTTQYLLPGLFGLILMLVTVVSTSLSIVREKELGTWEQLKTSPLQAHELIIGKVIPYLLIALVSATLILILGYLMFGVEVRGSLLLLYGAILLFLLAGLGQGLLISTLAQTQQVAYLASIFSSLLPAFLLSGFIFPINSMPIALQVISNVQSTKFFLLILRSIVLKGAGFWAVWDQYLFLFLFALITIGISSLRLRKELAS